MTGFISIYNDTGLHVVAWRKGNRYLYGFRVKNQKLFDVSDYLFQKAIKEF